MKRPLFPGDSEIDELFRIFRVLGIYPTSPPSVSPCVRNSLRVRVCCGYF